MNKIEGNFVGLMRMLALPSIRSRNRNKGDDHWMDLYFINRRAFLRCRRISGFPVEEVFEEQPNGEYACEFRVKLTEEA